MNLFEKWRLLRCRMDQMDEVAVRLDQLQREGKIPKDQFFTSIYQIRLLSSMTNNIYMMRMLLSFILPSCT